MGIEYLVDENSYIGEISEPDLCIQALGKHHQLICGNIWFETEWDNHRTIYLRNKLKTNLLISWS